MRPVTLGATAERLDPVIEVSDVHRMIAVAAAVHVDDSIYEYAVRSRPRRGRCPNCASACRPVAPWR